MEEFVFYAEPAAKATRKHIKNSLHETRCEPRTVLVTGVNRRSTGQPRENYGREEHDQML